MPYARGVGFGREARRVRNDSLPVGYRLRALGSCIQLAQPIGFNASWSYLQANVQRTWREPEFLLPALDLLEAERQAHLLLDIEYSVLRRAQKRHGYRFPPRSEVTPKDPVRWHGDERVGARHALDTWRRIRPDHEVAAHPSGRRVVAAVDDARATQGLPVLDATELQSILDWARRQIHVIGWEADHAEYRVAWNVYRLLGQLHLLAYSATPVGTPWNFRAT